MLSVFRCCVLYFFFFKQKTAYEMRISDWSSDVCSSDLDDHRAPRLGQPPRDRRAQLAGTAHYGDHCFVRHNILFIRRRSSAPRPVGKLSRSEERRLGKECAVRVELGGRRIIKNKKTIQTFRTMLTIYQQSNNYRFIYVVTLRPRIHSDYNMRRLDN